MLLALKKVVLSGSSSQFVCVCDLSKHFQAPAAVDTRPSDEIELHVSRGGIRYATDAFCIPDAPNLQLCIKVNTERQFAFG
jgi:hypothetical protein